jgi:hypothetical protein
MEGPLQFVLACLSMSKSYREYLMLVEQTERPRGNVPATAKQFLVTVATE